MSQDSMDFLPIAGIRLGVAEANIKIAGKTDFVVIELSEQTQSVAVFTQNAFCAAPVVVAKRHLASIKPRYLMVNSGNANAGTGERGMRDAMESCQYLASATAVAMNQILPFSTGVIGEYLDTNKIANAVPAALADLSEEGWGRAAVAIMTTDTRAKLISKQCEIDGEMITVTGMSKGSGMIHPNMATMLAYIGSDVGMSKSLLQDCLADAVEPSFNAITVDGDTSTNDACVLMASGHSSVVIEQKESDAYRIFSACILEVCRYLAKEIVRDGEGATKLVEVIVEQAGDHAEAKEVAFTVAHSPLVKTALFASDPNWGRVLAAVGRAKISALDVALIDVYLGDVQIVSQGGRDERYTEEQGQAVMDQVEITIRIVLGRGESKVSVLTCDLSYDYVKINAEYRS